MVRDTAGVAGSQIGPEGFFAGMDRIAGEEERDADDPHQEAGRGLTDLPGYIGVIDQFPATVVFDGALSAAEKARMQRNQGRGQDFQDRIVRRRVEIADGENPVATHLDKRIDQAPEPPYRHGAPRRRKGRTAVFGGMVVHQDGEIRIFVRT